MKDAFMSILAFTWLALLIFDMGFFDLCNRNKVYMRRITSQ